MQRRALLKNLGVLPVAGLMAGVGAYEAQAVPLTAPHTLLLVHAPPGMDRQEARALRDDLARLLHRDDVTIVINTGEQVSIEAVPIGQTASA